MPYKGNLAVGLEVSRQILLTYKVDNLYISWHRSVVVDV